MDRRRLLPLLAVLVVMTGTVGGAAERGAGGTAETSVPTDARFTAGSELSSGEASARFQAETDAVLIAAGDIATCARNGDEQTAQIIRGIAGTVATLGDNAYEKGTNKQFAQCYDPTWGTEKNRTRPSVGNHEYYTRGAAGYFGYFGSAAGNPKEGYYSYDLGAWHIIVLNSNCGKVNGCTANSPQGRWLQADLAANPATCTLAYWHHPMFSSGSVSGMRPFWDLLYAADAEIVLSGHVHGYERFRPQTPNGQPDPATGIRQFVVGTGGHSHTSYGNNPPPNSEVRNDKTFGVLVLTLRPEGYDWEFIPIQGKSFTDSGSGACH